MRNIILDSLDLDNASSETLFPLDWISKLLLIFDKPCFQKSETRSVSNGYYPYKKSFDIILSQAKRLFDKSANRNSILAIWEPPLVSIQFFIMLYFSHFKLE